MLNTTNVDSWGSSNKISRLFYITSITLTLMQDNRTIFNWVSEVIRDCLGFYDWYRKLAPLSKSIPFKTKTKRDLANRVFPRFGQLARSKFEFSLAHRYFLSLRLAVSISLTLALRHSIEGPSTNCVFIVPNRSPKSSMWTTTVISLPVQKTMCFDGDIAVIFPEEEVVWVTVSLGAQHHSGHVKSQG